jgi:cardiolipin synthase
VSTAIRVGVLAVALAVFASCTSLKVGAPVEPPPIVTRHRALSATESERLLHAALADYRDDAAVHRLIDAVRARATTPLTAGNRVTILLDGPQTFAAIRAAVAAAHHHIHIETFIYDDDELGREFGELLMRKRGEGVQVRVLYDSIGSRSTKSRFFDALREAGVEVREFRPVNPLKTPLVWKMQNRDHRKIIVVDGAVGFTGGINISGTYASPSASRPGPERGVKDGWRDTHVEIEGPAVARLQELFLEMWARADAAGSPARELCCDADYFPQPQTRGRHLVSIVATDVEQPDDLAVYATYLAAFENASSRLWITHAYFAPNEALLDALLTAAQRGVDVRLIAPGFTDSGLILNATRSTYARLLRGGVKIYERNDALLHAKTVVVVGVVSIVGSANLDMRSFLHNDEVNAVVVSRDVGRRMEEVFRRDEQASRPVDLEEWNDRGVWQRFKEFGSRLLWYWL